MKKNGLDRCFVLLVLATMVKVSAEEVVIEQYFDGNGTPYLLTQHLDSSPSILLEGSSGNFLRLIHGSNWQVSTVVFDTLVPPHWQTMTADFHFRMSPLSLRADRFSLVLLDADQFGPTNQIPLFYSEEPNLPKSLGVAFDIYYNNRVEQESRMSPNPYRIADPDNNHVSVHFDGQVVAQVPIAPALFDIANDEFNHCHITLTSVQEGAELTVRIIADKGPHSIDFTPVDHYLIPGFQPYQSRVLFAARVGSGSTFHDLDNIRIRFSTP